MIPPFAWVGELVPFFLRWGHKSQHVCHNVHKKLLVRSLFYTCIYFELTKHLGCGFKVQVKFLLDKVRDGFADTTGGSFALAEDDAVVCIADKAQASSFEFLVEFVQHDIAQQWTEGATLRRTFFRWLQYPVYHYTAAEILVYQRY